MKTYFDMYLTLLSLFFVCCLLPHLTGGASQLCSAGASHGDGCALSAHCVGSGAFLEWETIGYPQVDVLNLEYQKNNGEHHTIVSYYLRRQGSHTFLAPEGGQVTWTFSGCYHNDFWTQFSVASLTLTCGDAVSSDSAQLEADFASEPLFPATSSLQASPTLQTSSTLRTSSIVQALSASILPSPSVESAQTSLTLVQTVPANTVTPCNSCLNPKPDVGLEFVEVEEEVKSRKKSGGVSGRERRVAGDIKTGTGSRMEYKGLSKVATFFLGAVLGGGVAVVIIGAFVVAKQHKQRAPALNI